MGFKVIKGTFHVTGYSPDGDSVRFKADNEADWADIYGPSVKLNSKNHAQLRLEAVDTLETHYKTKHQPPEFADAATKELFKNLGITNVIWNESRSKVVRADDGVEGYILTRTTDRYGRPISFAFNKDAGFTNGNDVFLDRVKVKDSVNFKVLSAGLAYPTFYEGLFYDLREVFAKAALDARSDSKGVWPGDKTNTYFHVEGYHDIENTHIMMPKLFRRIVAFIKEFGYFDAAEFKEYLESETEKVFVLTNMNFTHFDNLISVNANSEIKMTVQPENIIFLA